MNNQKKMHNIQWITAQNIDNDVGLDSSVVDFAAATLCQDKITKKSNWYFSSYASL